MDKVQALFSHLPGERMPREGMLQRLVGFRAIPAILIDDQKHLEEAWRNVIMTLAARGTNCTCGKADVRSK